MADAKNATRLGVSRETLERLNAYVSLLVRWNRTINLIARGDVERVWTRHIADSMQLVDYVPDNCESAVDLGSGAGFPGLVLAIATGIPFALIESDLRRAAFLSEAVRVTGAPARVIATRMEATSISPVRLITARGFAPVAAILELCAPIVLDTGRIALLKGAHIDDEVNEARRTWDFELTRAHSRTNEGSAVLVISIPKRRSDKTGQPACADLLR